MSVLDWLRSMQRLPDGRDLTVVTGMQKSGTTAIAKLLGAAAEKTVCSDPFYKIYEKKKIDFRSEIYASGQSLDEFWREHRRFFSGAIVKDPDFALLLPQIRALFPQSRIVFIMRDPRDTIRSILNRLNLPGDPDGIDLSQDSIPYGWRKILNGKEPEIPGDNYIEVLSRRWLISAEAYFEHREFCTLIKYEDFKKDKRRSIDELASFLDLKVTCDISDLVDIQYQPKGNSDISWSEFFGEKYLQTIDEQTAKARSEFSYSDSGIGP